MACALAAPSLVGSAAASTACCATAWRVMWYTMRVSWCTVYCTMLSAVNESVLLGIACVESYRFGVCDEIFRLVA